MLLMGSKHGGQIPQVHWENFLITVIFLFHLNFFFFLILSLLLLIGLLKINVLRKYCYWASFCLPGCDALACAVCIVVHNCCIFLVIWHSYIFTFLVLIPVWNLSIWEHCHVRKIFFLVLGTFSCSLLWCNVGTVSFLHQLIILMW